LRLRGKIDVQERAQKKSHRESFDPAREQQSVPN
jgi:hypothetical protein